MSAGYVPSPFIVNILDLQNITSNITGLGSLQQLTTSVSNIQQMVNFDQKRIFVNTISKFDQTPIQVIDDINLSNAQLFVNGSVFSGSGGLSGSGGDVSLSSGSTRIFLTSSPSFSSPAIGFQVGGRTIFSFDSQGRALYFDPSGTGNRFWISSATLVADRVQLGGSSLGAQSGKVLTSLDTSGSSVWNYQSSLQAGPAFVGISSGRIHFITGGIPVAQIDNRQNLYFGSPALSGNNDLITRNNVTVVGGQLRYQGGGSPAVGQYVMVADSLGTLKVSSMSVGPSSFIIGDQIQSGPMNVSVNDLEAAAIIRGGSLEIARFISSGRLGILKPDPKATLHVGGPTIIEGDVTISTIGAIKEYVLTAQDTNGLGRWANIHRLFGSTSQQEWRLREQSNDFRVQFASGGEQLRFSSGAAFFGVASNYNLDVNGTVAASIFSSRSPLRFFINKATEVARIQENGFMGIGISSPLTRLHVNGSISSVGNVHASGNLFVGGSAAFAGSVAFGNTIAVVGGGTFASLATVAGVTVGGSLTVTGSGSLGSLAVTGSGSLGSLNVTGNATVGGSVGITGTTTSGSFSGDGANILNIATNHVGSGSNRLDIFQNDTRNQILATNASISTISTFVYSTLQTIGDSATMSTFSTLSSMITQSFSTLSSLIGPGVGVQISSFSTVIGNQFSTNNVTGFQFGSTATLRFPSSVGALAAGYKMTGDLSGAIDVSGLIFSQGLRGIKAPFLIGVGQSTTTGIYPAGITGGQGWKFNVEGDIDISGNLYKNGLLYNLNGMPDLYWSRTPSQSNIFFNDGAVGIGVTFPSYPLDVAGKIRCFGIDIIPGPGPIISSAQGVYVSPWLFQGSNIFYNGGGVGIGTGISSISTGIMLDISGSVRLRNGKVYLEPVASTLGIGYPFGSVLRGSADINGDLYAATGTFAGRVTALDFVSPSDRRLKKEISLVSSSYDVLKPIHGYRYKWRENGQSDIGIIAQEVVGTLPEAVNGDLEKGFTVSYDKLIPILIECVHDLRKEIDELKLAIMKNI